MAEQRFSLPVGAAATLACIYEATTAKPGNVHPAASFGESTTYAHFVRSAVVVGPILERVTELGVGRTVLEAVRATHEAVGTNTNLGTLLLVAPLAVVSEGQPLAEGVRGVLARLTHDDTRAVYEAIRTASAGGLGRAEEADVFAEVPPNLTLVDTMRLAADRDLVARQYVNGFEDVFRGPVAWIEEGVGHWPLGVAIVHAHVRQLAACGDSLIGRKCGDEVASQAKERAVRALESGAPGDARYEKAIVALDDWLRADGNRRNPGTTADLIATGLFVLLREGRLDWKRVTWM